MAGTLQPFSWGAMPAQLSGGFGTGAPWASPAGHLLQQLQFVPQQLQQVQQAEYAQQQQLQQVLYALQSVPYQIQQILQVIQYLPQHVAQLVQQSLASSTGIPPGAGIGTALPFAGLSTGTPLQSPVFGSPFQSLQPVTNPQFASGQAGYVM
jgi:hypothetical protein